APSVTRPMPASSWSFTADLMAAEWISSSTTPLSRWSKCAPRSGSSHSGTEKLPTAAVGNNVSVISVLGPCGEHDCVGAGPIRKRLEQDVEAEPLGDHSEQRTVHPV